MLLFFSFFKKFKNIYKKKKRLERINVLFIHMRVVYTTNILLINYQYITIYYKYTKRTRFFFFLIRKRTFLIYILKRVGKKKKNINTYIFFCFFFFFYLFIYFYLFLFFIFFLFFFYFLVVPKIIIS
jgi:hypothetical protein